MVSEVWYPSRNLAGVATPNCLLPKIIHLLIVNRCHEAVHNRLTNSCLYQLTNNSNNCQKGYLAKTKTVPDRTHMNQFSVREFPIILVNATIPITTSGMQSSNSLHLRR